LLLNPVTYGGIGNPDAIKDRLLHMGIKNYNFNEALQNLAEFQPLDRELQPGEQMRKYTKTLDRQSVNWKSLR
jgi:hypothetical protein